MEINKIIYIIIGILFLYFVYKIVTISISSIFFLISGIIIGMFIYNKYNNMDMLSYLYDFIKKYNSL